MTAVAARATLEIDDLTVSYRTDRGPLVAASGVSLVVPAGSTLGLVGESGSGKTTVGKAILRSLPAGASVTGSIRVAGQETVGMPTAQFQKLRWNAVSMVFQNALEALNPVYSIGHQLTDVLVSRAGVGRAEARERAATLMRQVDLDPTWFSHYPHQLSGGMKQRVMIAMALLCRPSLVIADEPTTALDVIVRQQIIELLQRVCAESSASLMIISHDLEMIGRLCEHVAVMYAGQIVEFGSRDDVLNRPRHPYTKALMDAYPTLDGPLTTLRALPGDPPDISQEFVGCRFRDRCPMAGPVCATVPPAQGGPSHWGLCHFSAEVPDA